MLRAGDVQWMTAGRGVLHSEMPHGGEIAHTLQLWLNLPARMKMIPARYRDQRLSDTPVRKIDHGEVRVYAGRSGEVSNGHGSDWPMWLLELRLEEGGALRQELPAAHRGFVYVLEGSAEVGGAEASQGEIAWFEPGAAYGPFVMNTRQEIIEAFRAYQAGRLVAGG